MSTLRLTTISNQSGSASVPSDTVINGSAKAWVNFNGTGTVAIRASFNVSSITDNGTGDYTVNFTNALADANYSVVFGGLAIASFSDTRPTALTIAGAFGTGPTLMSTTQVRLCSGGPGITQPLDTFTACVSVFR